MKNNSCSLQGGEVRSRGGYKVFSEGQVASLTTKNRLARSGTYEAAMTGEGKVTDGMLTLYKNLSQGGVGTIITGAMAVMPEAKMLHKQSCVWNDGHID